MLKAAVQHAKLMSLLEQLKLDEQQMIAQQGPLTAQQERMHRRLAKRKDEEKQSLGPLDSCRDVKASVYVSELSGDDLVSGDGLVVG